MRKAFLTEAELTSAPKRRGRYPLTRCTLRSQEAAGCFVPGVRISKGRKGWEEDILDVFDAVLASTGDPKLAVRAALQARAERVSKIAPEVAKFVAQAISDSAAVA